MKKCDYCGVQFEPRQRTQRFCSRLCNAHGQPPCTLSGCNSPRRAKGLCNSHYKREHGGYQVHLRTCVICGGTWRTINASGKFCSDTCKGFAYTKQLACPVPETHPSRSCRVPLDHPSRRPHSGICEVCGEAYRSNRQRVTCSSECRAKRLKAKVLDSNQRRRARQREAYVAPVFRLRIFERDGWRCHLCGKRVDRNKIAPHPLSPSIDHVIPLAWGRDAGGTHEPANVRTAHFLCNSIKGDRGGNEQLLLIG